MDLHLPRTLPTTSEGWTKPKTATATSAATAASAVSALSSATAAMHAAADAINYCRTTDTFTFAGAGGDSWEQPLDYFPGVGLQGDERQESPWRTPPETTGSNSGNGGKYRPSLYSNGYREKTGWAWVWSDGKQRLAIVLGKEDYNDNHGKQRKGSVKGGANGVGGGDGGEVAPVCSVAADGPSKPHPATTVDAATTFAATSIILTYTPIPFTTPQPRRDYTRAQHNHALVKREQHQQYQGPSQPKLQQRPPRQGETKKNKRKNKQNPSTIDTDTSMFSYRTAMRGYEDMRFAYEMQPHKYPRLGACWEPPKRPVVELAGRVFEDVYRTDRGEKGAVVLLWFRKRP